MPPKRLREDDDTKIKNEILHKNLIDFISKDKFIETNFIELVNELIKLDINSVIEYIDSCNKTNKKSLKEIFYLIGGIYNNGINVEKNLEKAFEYTKMAADFGVHNACFNTGHNYKVGSGCEKNIVESFKYFKIAAINNNIRAQYLLGEMYENGTECEKNMIEAFKYYKLCADNTFNVNSDFYKKQKKFTIYAKYNVGALYIKGIGVEKNVDEGIKYFKMSAEDKFPQGIYSLFTFYYSGKEVEKNIDEAIKYLKLGAEVKDVHSIYHLIVLYYNYGLYDIPQNIDEGFKYIKLYLECVTVDNIYCKVNKKMTIIGSYLQKIIYEILLQNDMELYFVQEVITKYKIFSNLHSLLQFKINKRKLPNYYNHTEKCSVCFEENIPTHLFDCLGHYYCIGCTIKIKECCMCKSHKRCFH